MRKLYQGGRLLAWLPVCAQLAACGPPAPLCPFTGEPDYAVSAGCLAVRDDRILVAELKSGEMTPPGGKALPGESAQCAAHRETWEETGLDLLPGELVHVFDTGFHLYRCDYYRNYDALNTWPSEVNRALWLPISEVDEVQWRFPGQGKLLRSLAAPGVPAGRATPRSHNKLRSRQHVTSR